MKKAIVTLKVKGKTYKVKTTAKAKQPLKLPN